MHDVVSCCRFVVCSFLLEVDGMGSCFPAELSAHNVDGMVSCFPELSTHMYFRCENTNRPPVHRRALSPLSVTQEASTASETKPHKTTERVAPF